jgi:hypothetical protein
VLRNALRGLSLEEMQAAFGRLGSSWVPEHEAELKELDEILSRAET